MRHFTLDPLPGTAASLEVCLREKAYDHVRREARPCVLICPGGAYRRLSSREAEPVALAFLGAGFQVCVLRYSVRPDPSAPPLGDAPLQEAARAIRTVRENAADWGVDPDKVSILGFSAGGHLAGSAGIFWDSPRLPGGGDGLGRPNGMLLCYPVVSGGEFAHRDSFLNLTGRPGPCPEADAWALEKHVSPRTPPAFLWHTVADGSVPVENALLLAGALRQNGVPFELHLFTDGAHGASLASAELELDLPAAQWLPLALAWLKNRGLGPDY